jgi:sugar transferase (PEP-CTERM/EpsH1 system associated)
MPAPSPASPPGEGATLVQITWSLTAGGMEMYALRLAAHLTASRFESVICPLDKGGALEVDLVRLGIRHHVMNRRPGIDIPLMVRLYRLFKALRADIVHTHHFNGLFHAAVAARLAGARVVHTEHSTEDFDRPHIRTALRLLSALCDRVVAISPGIHRALCEDVGVPASKVETVLTGIDLDAFDEPRDAARQAMGMAPADRVAVVVARLYPEKNHALLLDAFADVAARMPQARLLVVGGGSEEAAIGAAIDRLGLGAVVRLLGVRLDVARILAAADVFVLASLREGLPIAVLEAMAAGLPVIATSVGDVPLLVQDGETGMLVPSSDRESLARRLEELLSDPRHASRLGANAKRAAGRFSLRAMVSRYEGLYEDSLARSRARRSSVRR